MARKKATTGRADRSNPNSNKSLAIRIVLKKMPNAKASEVAAAVKKEYGHEVSKNMIYMVKTKANMKADRREKKQKFSRNGSPMKTAALWVDAIKTARQLLKATGSVSNATSLLKALDT
jgi:hypothetical protein